MGRLIMYMNSVFKVSSHNNRCRTRLAGYCRIVQSLSGLMNMGVSEFGVVLVFAFVILGPQGFLVAANGCAKCLRYYGLGVGPVCYDSTDSDGEYGVTTVRRDLFGYVRDPIIPLTRDYDRVILLTRNFSSMCPKDITYLRFTVTKLIDKMLN